MRTKILSIIIASLICGFCIGQVQTAPVVLNNKLIRKIKIKHADPYLIWLLLNGQTTFITQTETTAIKKQKG